MTSTTQSFAGFPRARRIDVGEIDMAVYERGVPQRIDVPTLFIGASDEVVAGRRQVEAMRPHVTDLEIHMIEGCGHWSQQEKPDEVNAVMLEWMARRYPAA